MLRLALSQFRKRKRLPTRWRPKQSCALISRNEGPNGPTDEAIRSYSSQMVNRAYRALFHAIELKQLVNRFAQRLICARLRLTRALSGSRCCGNMPSALRAKMQCLRQEIQPIFFPGSSLQAAEEVSIQSDADLARAVERLHKLALSNNEAIRSAFTISSQSSAVAIKSAAFWQSIQRAENFAKGISQYQAVSN